MYLLSTLVAQHMDDNDHGMGGGWWWLWGTLMMIVVLAAIGLVVWLIVRSVKSGGGEEPLSRVGFFLFAETLRAGVGRLRDGPMSFVGAH
jgi:hypothetical protein